MRIDEFEFRNEKGQEIEPTKAMLVCYIKALHKDIKILAKALELACEELYSDNNEAYCKTPTAVYKTDCEFNGECSKCKLRYFKQKAEKELSNER